MMMMMKSSNFNFKIFDEQLGARVFIRTSNKLFRLATVIFAELNSKSKYAILSK